MVTVGPFWKRMFPTKRIPCGSMAEAYRRQRTEKALMDSMLDRRTPGNWIAPQDSKQCEQLPHTVFITNSGVAANDP